MVNDSLEGAEESEEMASQDQDCRIEINSSKIDSKEDGETKMVVVNLNGAEEQVVKNGLNSESVLNPNERLWRRRLKFMSKCFCLNYSKNKPILDEISLVFAKVNTPPYWSPSTMLASYKQVKFFREAQKEWCLQPEQSHLGIRQFLSHVPITSETKFLDVEQSSEDAELIKDMMYFMQYSSAPYGWKFFTFDGPHQMCCLFPYMRLRLRNCCFCPAQTIEREQQHWPETGSRDATTTQNGDHDDDREDELKSLRQKFPINISDNWLGCNLAALDRRLRGRSYDKIYANFTTGINKLPFLVVADHTKRTIVVSIRGTMSFGDAITDLNCFTDPLPLNPIRAELYGHRGAILTSVYIKDKMEKHRVLQAAFACRPDLGTQNYQLLFCGHSIGAGIAAILGLLYLDQYPALKAYLYSPPGGSLSRQAVELTKKFSYGVFQGNDWVPRIGLAQIQRLKYQSLAAKQQLAAHKRNNCKTPGAGCNLFCCTTGNDQIADKLGYNPEQSIDFLFGGRKSNQDCPPIKNEAGELVEYAPQNEVLYTPGRLIHIVKDFRREQQGDKKTSSKTIYRAVWVDNVEYDRIFFDDNMVFDHIPANLMRTMKLLFKNSTTTKATSSTSATTKTTTTITSTNGTTVQTSQPLSISNELKPCR